MAEMKADGVEYEERLERLAEITYPKPLEELLDRAFELYCQGVPWARDYELLPKSVLRDMVETASDFKTYIGRYGIAKSEGTLLRYLSDAFRVLVRTLPPDGWTIGCATSSPGSASWCAPPTRAGGRVGERRRAARGRRAAARRATPWWPTVTAWRSGAQRAVRPRAPGRARSHPRAGQPRRGMGLRRARWNARLGRLLRRAQRDPPRRRRAVRRLPDDRREPGAGSARCGTSARSSGTRKTTTTSA